MKLVVGTPDTSCYLIYLFYFVGCATIAIVTNLDDEQAVN